MPLGVFEKFGILHLAGIRGPVPFDCHKIIQPLIVDIVQFPGYILIDFFCIQFNQIEKTKTMFMLEDRQNW